MLSNYDARAIAEVMGLAFVRQPDRVGNKIVIYVDDEQIAVGDGEVAKRRMPSAARHQPSPISIEKAVSSGLPRHALRHVAEAIAGSDTSRISALEWDVVPKTTLDRRRTRLSVTESERTERIARLFVHARRALGSEQEAREFITTLHPEFDGRSPLDMATTDLGTRRVEQVLNALEYGLAL